MASNIVTLNIRVSGRRLALKWGEGECILDEEESL